MICPLAIAVRVKPTRAGFATAENKRVRRRLPKPFVCSALAITALANLFLLVPDDPLAGARRHEPLGADEEAVAAARGRTADGVIRKVGQTGEVTRRVLLWRYDDDPLLVEFDEVGLAVQVVTGRWRDRTLWHQVRAWLWS
jgi:hypothetical protein